MVVGGTKLSEDVVVGGRDQGSSQGTGFDQLGQEEKDRLAGVWEKDRQVDRLLDELAGGVLNLKEIALLAQGEVESQEALLDILEEDMERAQVHVETVNEKMKRVVKLKRRSTKLCFDVLCLIITLGLLLVFFKVTSSS